MLCFISILIKHSMLCFIECFERTKSDTDIIHCYGLDSGTFQLIDEDSFALYW